MERKKLIQDLEEAVSKVCAEIEDVVAVYIYGSFARGNQDEESDVDVALLFEHNSYGVHRFLDLARKIESRIHTERVVDVRDLNSSDIVFQKKVLEESILLYEGNEESRMDFERKVFRKYLDMKPHIQHYYDMRSKRVGA